MKRLTMIVSVLVLILAMATSVLAQDNLARVRVVHASPDAPAVDVWANGTVAFSNAPFKGITAYAALPGGVYNFQVTPTGATEPVVINISPDLRAGVDYTVVALNTLNSIETIILEDNNARPAAGKAHVRFVHTSPDAPAVDIAVAGGGPVLFSGIPFKGVGAYLPVDAGVYDLEVRVAGTNTVALSVPRVALNEGTVYTIFAMGLAGGSPALTAVPSVDATYTSTSAALLPESGGVLNIGFLSILFAGMALIGSGLALRFATIKVKRQ